MFQTVNLLLIELLGTILSVYFISDMAV